MSDDVMSVELRLLYEVSARDVEFFKKQQWLVSYYTIVLYGTLIGLSRVTEIDCVLLFVVVAVFASILLVNLEHSISVRRDRLKFIREHASNKFKRAWRAGKKRNECHMVVAFMLLAVIAGASLAAAGLV